LIKGDAKVNIQRST